MPYALTDSGAIFAGFAAFFVLDKTMRVLNAQAGNESGHGHSHHHHHHEKIEAKSTAVAVSEAELRKRKVKGNNGIEAEIVTTTETETKEVNPSLKLSAYLNLFGDFTHNITDGLAMAASFYSSPQLGAVTTIATFCHEIPHEVR